MVALPKAVMTGRVNYLAPGAPDFTFEPRTIGAPCAPMGVQFDITSLTDFGTSDLGEVVVIWDYDDNYAFESVTPTRVNDAQSGTSLGRMGDHVYTTPGTYNPTVKVYGPGGRYKEKTVEIVVPSADDLFSAANTVVISATGDFTGAPAGTQVTWTNTMPWVSTGTGKRYLLKRGDTFPVTVESGTPDQRTGPTLISDWGNPLDADPLLQVGDSTNFNRSIPGIQVGNRAGKMTITGIELRGSYDPTAANDWELEAVAPPRPGDGIVAGQSNTDGEGAELLLFRVKASKLNFCFDLRQYRRMIVDCQASDWFNYGFYGLAGVGGSYTLLANKSRQNPLAASRPEESGPPGDNWNVTGLPNRPKHGPCRITFTARVSVKKNHFESHNGWSSSNRPGGVAAIQPAIRLGTSSLGPGEENVDVTQNAFYYGFEVVHFHLSAGGTQQVPGPYVLDSNLIVMNGLSVAPLAITKAGAKVRNNLVQYPDGETRVEGSIGRLINSYTVSYVEDVSARPILIYNNTFDLAGDQAGAWTALTSVSGVPVQQENNVVRLTGSYDPSGTDAMFTTNPEPLDAVTLAPQSGSPAFKTATGTTALFDIDGTQRPPLRSKGAVEP